MQKSLKPHSVSPLLSKKVKNCSRLFAFSTIVQDFLKRIQKQMQRTSVSIIMYTIKWSSLVPDRKDKSCIIRLQLLQFRIKLPRQRLISFTVVDENKKFYFSFFSQSCYCENCGYCHGVTRKKMEYREFYTFSIEHGLTKVVLNAASVILP